MTCISSSLSFCLSSYSLYHLHPACLNSGSSSTLSSPSYLPQLRPLIHSVISLLLASTQAPHPLCHLPPTCLNSGPSSTLSSPSYLPQLRPLIHSVACTGFFRVLPFLPFLALLCLLPATTLHGEWMRGFS